MVTQTEQDHSAAQALSELREPPDPDRIISLLPIRPHHRVAEISTGQGGFTVALAKYLFLGKLYAITLQEEATNRIRELLAQARLSNAEVLQASDGSVALEPGSLQGAFFSLVLHRVEDPGALLKAVHGLLEPKGWAAAIEWLPRQKESEQGAPRRLNPQELQALVTEAGFQTTWARDLGEDYYLMILKT